ncbi:uncharacterized protein TRAVEDRAFT_24688 [Trametes versicolor FP-101664 SS1]|uniref:Uncharacterized protein n=1 Tax=Trametes versicolor (strain FP-101664) TaxID=717944 RepID=R7S8F9_TRAVS|nr:uncharacterized protein TRAVEDRAFT_24688 [Trametes versicolor FP-101664 SS1]EIW51947.1 hypothetical protein TRAVEDRAFT_24688 [Trametes versicolor FP-101664 SS1]
MVSHALETLRTGSSEDTGAQCGRLPVEVDMLALLRCEDENGRLLALPLRHSQECGKLFGATIGTHFGCTDNLPNHGPYRLVSLATEELEILLEYVRPTVSEVSLFHHAAPRPSIPKSLQLEHFTLFLALPAWPLSGTDLVVFDIAPHSIDALGVLGFVSSPLQVVRSELEIVLETTLSFSDGGSLRTPYTVEITFTLTELESLDTKACCSVKCQGAKVIESRTFDSSSDTITPTPYEFRVVTPQILEPTSKLNDHIDSSTSVIGVYSGVRRTLVLTEYTLQSDGDLEDDTRTCMVRLLRVALEFPFASHQVPYDCPDGTKFWLTLDLSDEYESTWPTESDLDSSERPDRVSEESPSSSPVTEYDGLSSPATRILDPVMDPPLETAAAMPLVDSDNPTSTSAVDISDATQAETSEEDSVQPQKPFEANARPVRFQTDSPTGILAESPLSPWLSNSNLRSSGTAQPDVIVPLETYTGPQSANRSCSRSTEEVVITSQKVSHLSQELGGSDTPQHAETQWSSSEYPDPPSSSTTRIEAHDYPQPTADADIHYALQDSVNALRVQVSAMSSQIAELTLQNAGVASENAILSMQVAYISSQMTDMFARFDLLTGALGPGNVAEPTSQES